MTVRVQEENQAYADATLIPITDEERSLAPEATDLQIDVAKIARCTSPRQLKPDAIQLEVFSFFLQCS